MATAERCVTAYLSDGTVRQHTAAIGWQNDGEWLHIHGPEDRIIATYSVHGLRLVDWGVKVHR